jgi:hypothetical protein
MSEDLTTTEKPLGLLFEFDPDRRIIAITFRSNRFELAPPRIEVPFAYQKESVAQILEFEAQMKIATLPPGTRPSRYPPGVRGKLRCAEIIMQEAKAELAAEAAVGDQGESEADKEAARVKANLGLIT